MSHSPDGSEDERVVYRERNEIYVDDGYESGNEDTPEFEYSTMQPRNLIERLIGFRLNMKNLIVFIVKNPIIVNYFSNFMAVLLVISLLLPFFILNYSLDYIQPEGIVLCTIHSFLNIFIDSITIFFRPHDIFENIFCKNFEDFDFIAFIKGEPNSSCSKIY